MATIGEALRTHLIAWTGVSNRVYRDTAPPQGIYPQVTFLDPVSLAPIVVGDGIVKSWERQIQIDLWQRSLINGAPTEDFVLAGELVDWLDGAQLSDLEGSATTMRVTAMQRLPDPDLDITRHTVTISLRHDKSVI